MQSAWGRRTGARRVLIATATMVIALSGLLVVPTTAAHPLSAPVAPVAGLAPVGSMRAPVGYVHARHFGTDRPSPSSPLVGPSTVFAAPSTGRSSLASSSQGYTEATLSLLNGTLMSGNVPAVSGNGVTYLTYDPIHRLFYAEGVYTDSIVIVNATSGRVLAGFDPGNTPTGLAVDGINHTVYAAAEYSNNLTVADSLTGAVRAVLPVGVEPEGVAFDPIDHRVFVGDTGSNNVTVIDTLNDSVVKQIHVGTHPEEVSFLDLNSTGRVYVANSGSSNLTVINASSLAINRTIPVGSRPDAPIFNPASNQLYVANVGSSNLTVLNATTDAPVKSLSTPGVTYMRDAVAINPRTNRMFVLGSANVRVFNGSNDSLVASVSVSGWSLEIAANPVSGEVYVAGGPSNNVSVLNGTNGSLVATVPSEYTPDGLAFDPATTSMWIANQGSSNISIINSTTHNATASIPLSFTPFLVGTGPANGTVYVGGACSGGLAEVNGSSGLIDGCIRIPGRAVGLTYDEQNGMLYVSDGSSTIYVVNASNGTVARSIYLGDHPYPPFPWEMALDPANGTLFVPTFDWGNLSVINLTTDEVVRVLGAGGGDVATYDPVDGSVWITTSTNKVLRYNATTYQSLPSVAVGSYPQGMVYDPLTREMYVANGGSYNVSVLNASTGKHIATLRVGINDYELGLDLYDDLIFCTNAGSNNVSVIDPVSHRVVATVPTNVWPRDVASSTSTALMVISDQDSSALTLVRANSTPGPHIESFTARPSSVPRGASTTLAAWVIDPNGTVAYAYAGLPPGCASANSSELNCTPNAPGSYRVTLHVVDPAGYSAAANLTLVAEDNLTAVTLQVSASYIDLHQSVTLDAGTSGGFGSLTYAYSGLPTGCSSANVSALDCTPTQAGNFTVMVDVTDQAGVHETASVPFEVDPDPSITSARFADPVIDVNQSDTLSIALAGGTAPFSFTYAGLPAGCLAASTADLPCTPTDPFNGSVQVRVVDEAGMSLNASVPLIVNARPSVSQVLLSTDPVENGTPVVISIQWSGGTAPFDFMYMDLPTGCASASAPMVTCVPSQTGNFSVTGRVTDARGAISSGVAKLTVSPAPVDHMVLIASFTSTPDPVTVNSTARLVVDVTGAVAQLNVSYSGLPPGCASENSTRLNCTPSTPGAYDVSVTVRDLYSHTATANLTLRVVPLNSSTTEVPPPAGTSGSTGWMEVSILGVVGLAAIVAAIVVVRRRRSKSGGGPVRDEPALSESPAESPVDPDTAPAGAENPDAGKP